MSLRRLLPFLMFAALVLAPFGRVGAAEAKAMPHHQAMQMAGHCAGQSQPAGEEHLPTDIDCMIACAAMALATTPFFVPPAAAETALVAVPASILAGVRPEAEPPPPRLS